MPVNKKGKSKWQEASILINDYRWKISNILHSFNEEEKQTHNYKDLIKEIKDSTIKAIRDASPADAKDVELEKKHPDKLNWKSFKLWILVCGSPLLVEFVKYLLAYITGITTLP